MSFSPNPPRVTALYSDTVALQSIQRRSRAAASLSKVQADFHALYFPEPAPDRPYSFASIVLSLDGKMAYPDDSRGPLVASNNALDPEGGAADYWILNVLRAYADASLIGARTLAAEPDAEFSCQDVDLITERPAILGKTLPLLPIVVSLDGSDVPLDHPAFQRRDGRPMIATCGQGGQRLKPLAAADTVWLGPFNTQAAVESSDLVELFRSARSAGRPIVLMTGDEAPRTAVLLYALRRLGIEHLLVESPTYWWHLLGEHALDELFVNYSSVYIGGQATPGGPRPFTSLEHPHARLLFVGVHPPGFLYTRQQLVYAPEPPA
mgnify:CR=1 FL=1